jgi:hypothetical protein
MESNGAKRPGEMKGGEDYSLVVTKQIENGQDELEFALAKKIKKIFFFI